jgi:hypothetical protein
VFLSLTGRFWDFSWVCFLREWNRLLPEAKVEDVRFPGKEFLETVRIEEKGRVYEFGSNKCARRKI